MDWYIRPQDKEQVDYRYLAEYWMIASAYLRLRLQKPFCLGSTRPRSISTVNEKIFTEEFRI